MSATNQLRELYETWSDLTEQEGRAIRAGDWPRVASCQADKAALQSDIQHTADELARRAPGFTRDMFEREFRTVVDSLIARERANERDLAAQRCMAETQRAVLEQSSRRLKQLHNAYAPGRHAAWQSYS